jgi:ribonucleoside-triphosphate reductase
MKEENKKHRTRKEMYNSEFVPAESLGAKNYRWDKQDGYWVPEGRNCYTSYFFLPDDDTISVLEKMHLHGKENVSCLDGGSACHLALSEHLSIEQYRSLLKYAGEVGCNYWTVNVKNTECKSCGYISKHTLDTCPVCGSKDLTYWTRIIGYLRRVEDFSEPRQIEESKRVYAKLD